MKCLTIVKGDLKAPFSLTITLQRWRKHYSFVRTILLTLNHHLIMLETAISLAWWDDVTEGLKSGTLGAPQAINTKLIPFSDERRPKSGRVNRLELHITGDISQKTSLVNNSLDCWHLCRRKIPLISSLYDA